MTLRDTLARSQGELYQQSPAEGRTTRSCFFCLQVGVFQGENCKNRFLWEKWDSDLKHWFTRFILINTFVTRLNKNCGNIQEEIVFVFLDFFFFPKRTTSLVNTSCLFFLLANISFLKKTKKKNLIYFFLFMLMTNYHSAALIGQSLLMCVSCVCRSWLRMLNLCPLPLLTPRIYFTLLARWWLSNMLLDTHTHTTDRMCWQKHRFNCVFVSNVGVMLLYVQTGAVSGMCTCPCVCKMEKILPVLLAVCVPELTVYKLYVFFFSVCVCLCVWNPSCTQLAWAGK